MSLFGKKDSDTKTNGDTKMPVVQLRVDSAYPDDQGGGKVRLDPETMLHLKVNPGDLVYIEGKVRTVAKIWRSLTEDWNLKKARIDNFTRFNAGINLGDSIKIIKMPKEIAAERVVLAPPPDFPKKIPIINNPQIIKSLIDFPVVKDDVIPIMLGLPIIQPKIVPFKCVDIQPDNAVIITKNTLIELSDQPIIDSEGVLRSLYQEISGMDTVENSKQESIGKTLAKTIMDQPDRLRILNEIIEELPVELSAWFIRSSFLKSMWNPYVGVTLARSFVSDIILPGDILINNRRDPKINDLIEISWRNSDGSYAIDIVKVINTDLINGLVTIQNLYEKENTGIGSVTSILWVFERIIPFNSEEWRMLTEHLKLDINIYELVNKTKENISFAQSSENVYIKNEILKKLEARLKDIESFSSS
jgi:hypothetical protein